MAACQTPQHFFTDFLKYPKLDSYFKLFRLIDLFQAEGSPAF